MGKKKKVGGDEILPTAYDQEKEQGNKHASILP